MKKSAVLAILMALASLSYAADKQCVIEVKEGWNLIGWSKSNKLTMDIVQSSTAKIISMWRWDNSLKRWEFFEPTKPYYGQVYAKEKGYGIFASAKPDEGYWINVKEAGSIDPCAEALPPSPGA